MPDYGVTKQGFVLKRMDTIMEEVHSDLTEGYGFDTRLSGSSFLDCLVTSFCGKIADLWEVAQDNYYAKYPATAIGVNLDDAVQYGGIRRMPAKPTCYPLHCTGNDGTYVREKAVVATNTMPEIRLYSAEEFQITRDNCNSLCIEVAVVESNATYSITINGEQYSYANVNGAEADILLGLKNSIDVEGYTVAFDEAKAVLRIEDNTKSRKNSVLLSDNLTTSSVTVIANFFTEEYGKITLPFGIITKMINNISGFLEVTNLLPPIYGRLTETDVELRQSYIAKSALRSNTMIDSIIAELLHNVPNVETASGYENCKDVVDERGLPPHSIEIIVEGGDNSDIASAILRRKAGGIQTFGSISVDVPGNYGDPIPIHFNRPGYIYTWIRVVLHGYEERIPVNHASLVSDSICRYGSQMVAGDSLLTQLLIEDIYSSVTGITYVEILTACSSEKTYVPSDTDYQHANIMVSSRQKVLIDEKRIEVSLHEDS